MSQAARSSLTAGDIDSCIACFSKIRPRALAMLTEQQLHLSEPCNTAKTEGEWDSLVRQLRAVRESLTSLHITNELTLEAYELSADVCACAGSYAELLKCLQQLSSNIYPKLQERACAAQQAAAGPPQRGCESLHTQQHPQQQRQLQPQQQSLSLQSLPQLQPAHVGQATQRNCTSGRHTQLPSSSGPPPSATQATQARDATQATSSACSALADSAADMAGAAQPPEPAMSSHDPPGPASPPQPPSAATNCLLPNSTCNSGGAVHVASSSPSYTAGVPRRAEMEAAFILYFVCAPNRPATSEIVSRLRHLAQVDGYGGNGLCGASPVLQAAAIARAVLCGDYVGYFRLQQAAPPLLRHVMRAKNKQMRLTALRTMVKCYRVMPVAAVERVLLLPSGQLQALIEELAGRGCKGAIVAAAALRQQLPAGKIVTDLTFK